MSKLIWLLRLFAKIWTGLAFALVAIGALTILVRHGWTAFVETFNPFNLWNTAAVILTFSPAFIAEKCARWLEERMPLTQEAAYKLLREYGAAFEQRSTLPLSTTVELPSSKERIKEAFRLAAAIEMQDKARLGLFGAAYIGLADFRPLTSTMESHMAEVHALKAEWDAWLQQLNTPFGKLHANKAAFQAEAAQGALSRQTKD